MGALAPGGRCPGTFRSYPPSGHDLAPEAAAAPVAHPKFLPLTLPLSATPTPTPTPTPTLSPTPSATSNQVVQFKLPEGAEGSYTFT